jgi:hypothetical protein
MTEPTTNIDMQNDVKSSLNDSNPPQEEVHAVNADNASSAALFVSPPPRHAINSLPSERFECIPGAQISRVTFLGTCSAIPSPLRRNTR